MVDGRKKNELGRLGDFRSKEEVAWLEEHFMDFAREQYLVRWDDCTTLEGTIEIELKRDVGK